MTKLSLFDATGRTGKHLWAFALLLVPRLAGLVLLFAVSLPVWPLYWLGCLIWYRPPNVPRWKQVARYLHLAWSVHPPSPGLSPVKRIWLSLSIVQKVLLTPILGAAWLLDELIYGRALNHTSLVEPIFVISAGRSGSTQIARYLEEDPGLAVPSLLQCMFPYLWLWVLAPKTLGRVISPAQVREKIMATMPPELLERHEMDPFKADTFDGSFYSFHLNYLALSLGPGVAVSDFHFAFIAAHDRELKEKDFVGFVDRIGRKMLVFSGADAGEAQKRFFIKGHFLYAADALVKHFPDACFLTVIREPISRLKSAINYLRVNPSDPVLGPVPWNWLALALERTESEYSEAEMDWFTRKPTGRCCVLRFTDFTSDLESVMKQVYRSCFDTEVLPPHVPKAHPHRNRTNYTVDRSLADLGIDEAGLRERLSAYIAWCMGD